MNYYLQNIIGKGYADFWRSEKLYRVNKGGRGSKKSRITALYFVYMIMYFYHVHNLKPCLLVCRKWFNAHRTSTRACLIWAINTLGVSHLWDIPKSGLSMTYNPSGQTIIFRGLDDPENLTSITVPIGTLCWVWLEEAYQITNKEDFDKLDFSIRDQTPAPLFKSFVLLLNPWNSLWWGKETFFDKPTADMFTFTTTYLENEFLEPDVIKKYLRLKHTDPRRYKVEGLGQWGHAAGLIYASFAENPKRNDISEVDKKTIAYISIGLDYGKGTTEDQKLGKNCMVAAAIDKKYRNVYAIKETIFDGLLLPDKVTKWITDFIVSIQSEYPGIRIEIQAEWASSQIMNNNLIKAIDDLGIKNVEVQNAYKGSIVDRIDLGQLLLADKRLLFLNTPCLKLAFQSALWDKEKSKAKKIPIRLDNGTTPYYDLLDCIEYAISKQQRVLMR